MSPSASFVIVMPVEEDGQGAVVGLSMVNPTSAA